MTGSPTPHGAWNSPISATRVAEGGVRIWETRTSGSNLYWIETRATEGGRSAIVQCAEGGRPRDLTPPEFNARTLAHEYGGGSFGVQGERVFFANFVDQRVYRQDGGSAPLAVTAEPERPRAVRFADFEIAPDGARLYCVRETHHEGREASNEVVMLAADGDSEPVVVASGPDFVSSPKLSPDGHRLAWLSWNHPQMPWDGTELWLGEVAADGEVTNQQRIAGGTTESIFQPEWSPEGVLHFVSDRSGYWNLYALRGGEAHPLAPMQAEFGRPQWGFGMATYGFVPDGRIVAMFGTGGIDRLGVIDDSGGRGITEISTPYTSFGPWIAPITAEGPGRVALIGASARRASEVAVLELTSGQVQVVKESQDEPIEPELLSEPRELEFPTGRERTAHALFYPPHNPETQAPAGELPPLIVISHGGPTAATSSTLNLGIQFWTSRGFAVVDVNYGGSTGYGREYRERLRGEWGVVDTEDCIRAAQHLAAAGEVDGTRLAIRGGSAGGYTTLCALTFHDVFAAGASYYGVSDAEALARDTHKFESRYLDSLIGPYPEAREIYRERSPIHFADQLSCPLLILQGLEDEVVPPSQAEIMLEALDKSGLPHAYLAFEGEQHGFRRAENIIRALEGELSFYARVFGFEPAGQIEPIEIRNEEQLLARLGSGRPDQGQ